MSALFLAIGSAYVCAVVTGTLASRPGKMATVTVVCGIAIVLSCPLLIPRESISLRSAAAFFCGDQTFKIVDYVRRSWSGRTHITFWQYCGFLVPFPVFLVVFPQKQRRLPPDMPRWPEVLPCIIAGLGVAFTIAVAVLAGKIDLIRSNFWVDHFVKVWLWVAAAELASRFLWRLERLAGYDTTLGIENMFLARTVAEFWRRYNKRVHTWLYHHVFRQSGARQAPIRAVAMVFLISGLFHELMFGMATSKFDGTQLAFFVWQIPAVLASGWMEATARRSGILIKSLMHAITIVWMVATSVLFFQAFDRVFPFFYASQ